MRQLFEAAVSWSYDSPTKGGLHHAHYPGRVANRMALFFTMIFPIILLLLLEAFLDNGWLGIGIYASVAIFMCATAWIPLILRKWITHLLLRDKPMSGKQQVQIIEWIHFHPLKKLLIFGLWGFGVVLVLRGIWVTAIGKIEMDGELFLFLLGTADRKSTRLNSSHSAKSRMPSSA